MMICARCYDECDKPKRVVRGYFFVELLCWAFILPGIAYTAWRLSTKRDVCPSCGAEELVPAGSHRGQEISARRA